MVSRKIVIPLSITGLAAAALFLWLSIGQRDYAGPAPYEAPDHLRYINTGSPPGCLIEPLESSMDRVGLVLYPGGKIAPEAYLPVAASMAELGMSIFVVKSPFNIAYFAPRSGNRIREARKDIEHWYVGGHSLGGVVASSRAAQNPEDWSGLILFASHATRGSDLSESSLPVLSIFGSDDNLVPPALTHSNAVYLPDDTMYVNIPGANHSGFGHYGLQNGDGEAGISPEEQRLRIRSAVKVFLERSGGL